MQCKQARVEERVYVHYYEGNRTIADHQSSINRSYTSLISESFAVQNEHDWKQANLIDDLISWDIICGSTHFQLK